MGKCTLSVFNSVIQLVITNHVLNAIYQPFLLSSPPLNSLLPSPPLNSLLRSMLHSMFLLLTCFFLLWSHFLFLTNLSAPNSIYFIFSSFLLPSLINFLGWSFYQFDFLFWTLCSSHHSLFYYIWPCHETWLTIVIVITFSDQSKHLISLYLLCSTPPIRNEWASSHKAAVKVRDT